MAELTVQTASRSGVTLTPQALTASDTFTNDNQTVLIISNGHSSDCTVSAVFVATIDGVAPAPKAITVAAGVSNRVFGPFPSNQYGSTVTITTSHQTSMTAACLKIS